MEAKMIAKTALKIAARMSDKNLIRTTKFIEKLSKGETKDKVKFLREAFEEGHPQLKLIQRLFKDSNPVCRKKVIDNLLYNSLIKGLKMRRKEFEKDGMQTPPVVLISPTMRCNLKCTGCYAMEYKKEDELSYEDIDKIIRECKAFGTHFFTFLGGEPFMRKEDILKLMEKHDECYFQIYTNCWLVDEDLIKKLAKLGNGFIITSIEGFEEETDARRGKGTYKHIIRTLDLLQEYGIPHGFSAVVTDKNWELLTSDKFVDLMIEKGMILGWYFLYMPIGDCPTVGMMPNPEERAEFGKKIREIRTTKDLMVLDFWNDAPLTGGCISARLYCHITSNGDVEPCIFTHFAVDNVKEVGIKGAFNSGFFKALREKQKQNCCDRGNYMLPCVLVDHPKDFREVYNKYKPRATHKGAESLVTDKKLMKDVDKYSDGLHRIYPKVWDDYLKENPWYKPSNPFDEENKGC
jgi:MoaA/NifB/PqqE/SkfB family radical SAM enzyme